MLVTDWMPNYHFSPRGTFAVILPSTNVAVEAEYNQMLVHGMSWHSGRILIRDPNFDSDEKFDQFINDLRKEIANAVSNVMTAHPDFVVMGMSSETFWGGKAGAAEFEALMKDLTGGLDVTTGAQACNAALKILDAKRIGIITPYQTIGDEQVRSYFIEAGYEVVHIYGLKCPTAKSIADVEPARLKEAFRKVNTPEIDALVQAGTNLFCAKVAAEMEVELESAPRLTMSQSTSHAQNSRRVPLDKRKRTETSCDKCKSRKQKCRKEPGQDACRYCLVHKIECLTTQPRKKRLYGSVEGLGSRLALLESLVKGLLPEADVSNIEELRQLGSSMGISLPESVIGDTAGEHANNSGTEGEESLSLLPDQQGQVQFIGPSSSFSFHLKLRALVGQGDGPVREFVLFGRNAADQEAIESENDLHALSTPSASSNIDHNSPVEQRAAVGETQSPEPLISAFFDHINPDFPVLHEASFREAYEQWDNNSERADPAWLCTLLCVLLLARRVAHVALTEDQEKQWWLRVQRLLPGVMFTSSIMAVQALMLAALHLHNTNHRDACWNLTGAAIRIAFAIGLHQDRVTTMQTPLARELRKRLWWTLYAFEQMQVSSYDRPSAIEHNPGSRIGCPNERLIGMATYCPPDYCEWFNRLVVHLASACRAPKTAHGNATEELYVGPLSPAAGVLRELDRWKESIPSHLKMDAVATSPPSFQRPLLLLHAKFHYTVSVLCRAALLHRATTLSKEGKDPANSGLIGMAEACAESGRALARILIQLESLGKFDPITWWDIWYALASGSVLVLDIVCCSNRIEEDVAEARILLSQLAALTEQHRRNPRMPGTIDKWASLVPELNSMATSSTRQAPERAPVTKQEEPTDQQQQMLPPHHDPSSFPIHQSSTNSGAYMFADHVPGRMYPDAEYTGGPGPVYSQRGFDRNTQMGFMDFSMGNIQDWQWADLGNLLGNEGVPPNNGA
ncbi:hypothetical protein BU24DRAFT_409013 [Aaosphaeria arxii CBS 175.79]|uniref:Zn(2)-C6 fungal-type domain-containing protein n=1 Tax=Aaosphaeria arxii CBS 175.79 TaxID=1450172 RepID=A0A6A5XRM7_9PLEO|nr:uncharacterized protein BU24DRAFT_409013 [Aaosphaeria arxii CBS 175.79]KAF2015832.1 hypothetical protein BU24DRAFT_409013 [Aaosphaeria arxii CBS 175.79]